MDIILVSLMFMFVLFAFLGSGIWVAVSLLGAAFVVLELFTNVPVGRVMSTSTWGMMSTWTLTAMPLFILMGEILFRSRLSEDMFSGLSPLLSRLPGGLLHVNILACALFAACSGSSAVTAATIGRMSLPELKTLNYPEDKSIATLAGSGTLGFLIPPSIILIVYGATAEQSVARLFIAGIFPGLMLVAMFMGYIVVWALFYPDKMPSTEMKMSLWERIYRTRRLIPVLLLIVGVIGSIYVGVATPTEAAAIGALGAAILSFFSGTLSWKTFFDSLLGAVRTTCMIGFIVAGAAFVTIAMAYTKIPLHLAEMIDALKLSPLLLIFVRSQRRLHSSHGRPSRLRPDLVWHLPCIRRRASVDHASGRLQLVRYSGTHRAQHILRRSGCSPLLRVVTDWTDIYRDFSRDRDLSPKSHGLVKISRAATWLVV